MVVSSALASSTPARLSPPGPGEVRVWLTELDPGAAVVDRLFALLIPDERKRAAQFQLRQDAMRWIVARSTLRDVLHGRGGGGDSSRVGHLRVVGRVRR
jgi:hypothetical protein